jgi:hypothetical protein
MIGLKRLDENTRAFEANGRRYIVHDGLTVDGFQMLEELRIEMEAGNTAGDLLKLCQKTYEALNTQKFADASVTLYNAINVAERISAGKQPAWMLSLTLFIRPEGTDLRRWDEAEAETWIADWNDEGYSIADLFTLALACRGRLDLDFLRSSPDISAEPNESENVQREGEKKTSQR